MILVELRGGLGNQMFQYAAARGLLTDKRCVYIDRQFLNTNDSDTEHFTARSYELQIFKNIKACKAKIWQVNLFKSQSPYFKYIRFFLKSSIRYIRQYEGEYISFSGALKDTNVYLEGYFQSEKYFMHIRKALLDEFCFPQLDTVNEALKDKIINIPNSVSVHIRRTDYLKSEFILSTHGVLTAAYYSNALDILQSKFPTLSLFVFSDDISWAKANFKREGTNIYFVDHNQSVDSWKDMALMKNCKHHILANSTFSWWGAWLNTNSEKIVIAPKMWFKDTRLNRHAFSIIPDTWITI